ncbi:hypothetical protein QU593_10535 [Rossellomorea marisflavi]|uniref:hypothetical protein n=1 Tax=Rossellomorea marisflavi TaxID=189381 RepID=UPI0025AF4944|nr:hypothetical protein [Rossellomorea marisflavi]WJV20843.1 hypothetical protein QU593_10535 [Rossellomorea marisflavi]
MKELEYNKQLTVGRLKESLNDIPDNVVVNVQNRAGDMTSNIYVWFEDLDTRQYVELMGFKPFYKMSDEEKRKCDIN